MGVAPPPVVPNHQRSRHARLRRQTEGRIRNQRNQPSSQAAHSSLDAYLNSLSPGNFFGDDSRQQSHQSTRILFQNVHGIPFPMNEEKQKGLFQCWTKEKVGIALLAEMNLQWSAVPRGKKWFDRVKSFTDQGHFSAVAYHEHQEFPTPSAFQWGGCSATLLHKVARRAKSGGVDETGLGRFSWIKIRGRDIRQQESQADGPPGGPLDLVVVSAYRPSKEGTNLGSVWNYQRNYWLDQGVSTNPREKFTEDLVTQIRQWKKDGCEVIVGVDANEDVSHNEPSSFRQKLREVGLSEAILRRHHGPYPATTQTNTSNEPIDGLFVSDGVLVKAGGYLDFQQYLKSDHRAIWIDIDLEATLGVARQSATFQPRRLTMVDGRSVQRYLKAAEEGYRQFDIPRRLTRLADDISIQQGYLTANQQLLFNTVHRQAYEIRRKAERNCRRLSMGRVHWSPKMQQKWDRLHLYHLLLLGHRQVRTSSRKVRRLMKSTGLSDSWKMTELELQEHWAAEQREYKEAKRNLAFQWRTEYLSTRSTEVTKAKKRSSQSRLRYNRVQRMAQREETRRRRKAQGKGFSGGLQQIKVSRPAPEGSPQWVTCLSRRLVEEGCMQENRLRYDQTRFPFPTPPMTEPLYTDFNGPFAESNSQALLQGTYAPASTDPYLSSFLNHCRRPEGLPDQHLTVDLSDHVSFWSKMGEHKGSEPHGLHNGHYKAGATSNLLACCDTVFRSIPFATGFVPAQWCHLMNFAIEKKPGEIRVDLMRTIQMMNSELQANNKRVGKAAMRYAESHQLIPKGQFGSRKQHQAIDLALTKRLTWDLLHLQRRPAGWISNDAKSCFDRIVHWVAIISLMRFGIQWKTLRSMFDTLMQSKHRVRTGFGDSERVFSPPSSIPFQGCGQGNGAGPPIWVSISSILLGVMISKGFGFDFLTSIAWAPAAADCFCFVDDTDVCQAASSPDTSGEAIVPEVAAALRWWTNGIRLTGGAIRPDKSFWYLIDFKWNAQQGAWKFRRKRDFKPSLLPTGMADIAVVMNDLDGTQVQLDWLESDQPAKTLGILMSPSPNHKPQHAALQLKARAWADQISPSFLHRYDVLPMLRTTIQKTLEYPMALTFLSKTEWEMILSPVLMAALPKAGICRNFPRAMVYAPVALQGVGVPHPYALQVTRHLDMLLRHPANATKTGVFLEAALQAHQLETGTSYGLFQQVYANTAILTTDTWVKRAWKELDDLSIHLEFDSPPVLTQRDGDQLLVDMFIESLVDQETLKWLNWCRIYLHAVTLSDIVTADGAAITMKAWTGVRDSHLVDRYQWPRTARPSNQWWRCWQQWLSNNVTGHSSRRRLSSPLGLWFHPDLSWRWQYSPSTGSLFHRQGQLWIPAHSTSSSSRLRTFHMPRCFSTDPSSSCNNLPSPTMDLPPDCVRASVTWSPVRSTQFRHRVMLHSLGPHQPTDDTGPPSSILELWHSFADRAASSSFGWVPEHITIDGDEARLIQALLSGSLRIVSDGSYKAKVGTACAQILTADRDHVIWITCQTPGQFDDQSSTRSELIGLLAALMVLEWMAQVANLKPFGPRPSVEIACDGLIALDKSFSEYHLQSSGAQFDLASTIRAVRRSLPVTLVSRHVKGHTDKLLPFSHLDWWEQRNVEVDAKAQAYRRMLESTGRSAALNPRFFHEPAALFIDGVKSSRLDHSHIMELVSLPALRTYWAAKGRLSASTIPEVDWLSLSRAMKALPANLQRWTPKHISGMTGVGKFLAIWQSSAKSACPRCSSCPIEDHLHVPRCPGPTATAEWSKRHAAFRSWMQVNATSPDIEEFLSEYLKTVRQPSLGVPTVRVWSRHPSLFQQAIASQAKLGAQGLLEGLLSHHWCRLQALHLSRIGSTKSANLWASRLIQQLIKIGHHMWQDRNRLAHSENSSWYSARKREIDISIREQFAMGLVDIPQRSQYLFRESREVILQKPLEDRQHWLRLVSRERALNRRSLARQRQMIFKLAQPANTSRLRPSGPRPH